MTAIRIYDNIENSTAFLTFCKLNSNLILSGVKFGGITRLWRIRTVYVKLAAEKNVELPYLIKTRKMYNFTQIKTLQSFATINLFVGS